MKISYVIQKLLHRDFSSSPGLTYGCTSCEKSVQRLRGKARQAAGWEDVPSDQRAQISSRLNLQSFLY